MNDDYKTEQEKLKEMVESQEKAITCLICLLRERIEMEAEFWGSLKKSLEEVR